MRILLLKKVCVEMLQLTSFLNKTVLVDKTAVKQLLFGKNIFYFSSLKHIKKLLDWNTTPVSSLPLVHFFMLDFSKC